jgi:hypothetical protein
VSKAFAEERKRSQTVLFPVRLDDAVMDTSEAWAVKLRDQRHIGDFRYWKDHGGYKRSLERVLRDLRARAEEIRARAETMHDAVIRQKMRQIAFSVALVLRNPALPLWELRICISPDATLASRERI